MDGLRLIDLKENGTTKVQQRRGEQVKNPFESDEFKAANRISIDVTNMFDTPGPGSVSRKDVESLIPDVIKAHQMLKNGEGNIYDHGIAMTGWQDLPVDITAEHLAGIRSVTSELSTQVDVFVSLGIGGSYLGIEATFRALTHNYFNQLTRDERGGAPEVYFLGQNMDPDFFRDTLDMLKGKRIAVNVISKSGTTTETAIAFRIIRRLMEENWGDDADRMILVTTDRARGALREMAGKRDYRTFVIPDNIGGRYSVLTDVGLVGLAMASGCLPHSILKNCMPTGRWFSRANEILWKPFCFSESMITGSGSLRQTTIWMGLISSWKRGWI
jgi:hypothetical protein